MNFLSISNREEEVFKIITFPLFLELLQSREEHGLDLGHVCGLRGEWATGGEEKKGVRPGHPSAVNLCPLYAWDALNSVCVLVFCLGGVEIHIRN